MSKHHFNTNPICLLLAILIALGATTALAQTTQFTYQGFLNDGSSPASGVYDLQFKLYTALSGGSQVGSDVTLEDVTVANGLFKVTLDFGVAAFPGADRFLEIGVRPGASTGAFTTLSPRQKTTSTPYAIRSLNATTADGISAACVNCVTSGQIAGLQGTKITGAIPVASVPAGSLDYIQNTTVQQAGANFNISGNGTAGGVLTGNIVIAATQFNINANRILSSPPGSGSLFAGIGAGKVITTGSQNSFFGSDAGFSNTSGSNNSFFGSEAGKSNTSGSDNSFFGLAAGGLNTTGARNSIFGSFAGLYLTGTVNNSFFGYKAGYNTTTSDNSFFGAWAGLNNTAGNANSFFGADAGNNNTTGSSNTFLGYSAGYNNSTGKRNLMLGVLAYFRSNAGNISSASPGDDNIYIGFGAGGPTTNRNSVVIGTNAFANCNDCMVLGSSQLSSFNVGIGTDSPSSKLTVVGTVSATQYSIGSNLVLSASGNQVQVGRNGLDTVRIGLLAGGAASHVCINNNVLSSCSSSLRYKEGVLPLNSGLNLIQRLRPVTFTWKQSHEPDLGLIAEEVAKVEPLLVTHNNKGEIEGVKYEQLNVVLINAVKEQQALIEQQQSILKRQQSQIERQQLEIRELKRLVCLSYPQAATCRSKK